MEKHLPWVEKFRPASLDSVLAQEDVIKTCELRLARTLSWKNPKIVCVCAVHRFIAHGQLPHLLLYGPPGTGKTTVAMACARQMHGEDVSTMVLQLNASDDRGIEMVRSYVKGFASTAHLFKKGIKLVILDEADAMTPDAQAALRRSTYERQTLFLHQQKNQFPLESLVCAVMEKYAATTRFCLICNYVGKIIPALQSRCTRFRFAQHRPDAVKAMLDKVVLAER